MSAYYCWREVETETGFQDQYLDAAGQVTKSRASLALFSSEEECEEYCIDCHEAGEVEFIPQGGAR